MIVCGKEKIFCYDSPESVVSSITDASQIVALNSDLCTAVNTEISIRKLNDLKSFDRFSVPFLRCENIFNVKFGGDPVFPTIRGFKSLSRIGKNDLVKMYDGVIVLCKTPNIDNEETEWYEITSKDNAYVIVDGVFVEL